MSQSMTPSECAILTFFRRFDIGPDEMMFVNPGDCKIAQSPFRTAMQSLIGRGFIVKERPARAYSLTHNGYQHSLRCAPSKKSRSSAQPQVRV
jgi:hypothetical protein